VLKHSTTKKYFARRRPIKCPEEFKPQIREALERWAPYKTSRIEFLNVFTQWFSALVGMDPGLIESGLSRLAYVSRTAVKEDYTNIAPLMLFYYGTYTGFIFRPKRDMPEGFARKCAQAYLNGYALPFSVAVLEGVLAWSPTLFFKLALAGYFTWEMAGKHAKAQVLLEKHAGIRTEPSYAWDLLILMASILSAEELGNTTFIAGCFAKFSKKISVTDATHPAQVFTSFGTAYYSGNSGYEIIVRKIMRCALLHWSVYQRLVEEYQKQLPE
jgi:hypothetical protein